MANEMMRNKKGSVSLRDMIFMIVIFSAIVMLATLFVENMSTEYQNPDMYSEYTANGSVGTLGSGLYGNVNSSVSSMSGNIDDAAGSFGLISGVIKGVGSILKTVISAPLYIDDATAIIMVALGVPDNVAEIIGNAVLIILSAMVIFVIVSALSRGGTKL